MGAKIVTITIGENKEGIRLKPVYEFEGEWTGHDATRSMSLFRRAYGKYQAQKRKDANKPKDEEIKDVGRTEPARAGKTERPKRKQ